MPATVFDSTAGIATAALPAGAASGNLIVVFAYRVNNATLPTLPASWTDIVTRAVSPALRVAFRVYDGSWTMPTFTSATQCHAMGISGQDSVDAIGVSETNGATSATITWGAVTLQDTSGASALLRGAAGASFGVVIPAPTGHTTLEASGTQPGYGTFSKDVTTSGASASSTVTNSNLWSEAQVEILSAAGAPSVTKAREVPPNRARFRAANW